MWQYYVLIPVIVLLTVWLVRKLATKPVQDVLKDAYGKDACNKYVHLKYGE